jgi:2-polyprenyl-6-methoxyphenol hydroxylase-like FAD-dependent oxidoreductase
MCEELQQLSEKEFIIAINKAFHNSSDATFLGSFPDVLPSSIKKHNFEAPPLIDTLETKRYAFPLTLNNANNLAANRMALIGDAAHRVHPLAGQGLNLGLTDVAYLSNCILKAMKTGQDIGSYDFVLKEYE